MFHSNIRLRFQLPKKKKKKKPYALSQVWTTHLHVLVSGI